MQITVDQIKAIGAAVYVVGTPEGDFIILGREVMVSCGESR